MTDFTLQLPPHLMAQATVLRTQLRATPTVAAVVEIGKGGLVKRRANGRVDFVSPVPCPFNYGHIPGAMGGDGDPLDALLLGARRPRGHHWQARVLGVVWFVDAGALDAKVVCGQAELSSIDRIVLVTFFRMYAVAKKVLNWLRGQGGGTRYVGLEDWGTKRSA